ncbi:MAG: sensor histidine kinase [Blautia sp.]|nr:sensor histidine kinase [Blautia sp.]
MSDSKNKSFINRFNSIQSVIFFALSTIVLLTVLISTTVSVRSTDKAIIDNSTEYTQKIIRQMNDSIDSYINYMNTWATVISQNTDAQRYLESSGEVDEECRQRLQDMFEAFLKSREDIRNVGIVGTNGCSYINSSEQSQNSWLQLESQDWYRNALSTEGTVLTSSHVQHIVEGERPWVITVSQRISGDDNKALGVVFIDLNYRVIKELCAQNNIGEKGYIYILDQTGGIVYHPQQNQLYNELQTENTELVQNSADESVTVGIGKNKKEYMISHSNTTDWSVVGCLNLSELLRNSRDAQKSYVLTAVLLVAAALILSGYISRQITLPIQKLRDSMVRVQQGDFSGSDLEVPAKNEIGSLTNSFNVMKHRISDLMEQNVREQKEKRKIELHALQSQINPHFLYNTLDSIIWMAEGKKNEEVVIMTASLARLLRQSIGNENEVVPIQQEIEYVRSYLTIQKMRYKDKLEFQIDVSPEILSRNIIKLVLQPIVENAIYHGIKYKESRGLLEIRGYREKECIIIEISDDGIGIREEVLKNIYERHKVNYRSNGVGVYNVQKRLQLYYGNEYGITYRSEPQMGTTAIIRIPANPSGQEEKRETV